MESDIERTHRDAGSEFRAVAKERAKWEEREARLVQRIKELERGAVVMSPNTEQVEREDSSGRLHRERSQRHPAAQEEPRSPRYAVTTVTAGCEEERGSIERVLITHNPVMSLHQRLVQLAKPICSQLFCLPALVHYLIN